MFLSHIPITEQSTVLAGADPWLSQAGYHLIIY
jgi:hypothetical protein